jgi:hypothetical protein
MRRAGIDGGGGQIMDGKTRHQFNSISGPRGNEVPFIGRINALCRPESSQDRRIGKPGATMWSLASRMVNSPEDRCRQYSGRVALPDASTR